LTFYLKCDLIHISFKVFEIQFVLRKGLKVTMKLKDFLGALSSEHDREHAPSDKDVQRNRIGRTIFFIFSLIFILFTPTVIGMIVASFLESNLISIGAGVGLAVGIGVILPAVVPYILVIVPKWQGLTTQNIFGGEIIVYGPGLHPRFPWEQIEDIDHHSLRLTTSGRDETYPTIDGEMKTNYSFQWAPRLRSLHIFRGVDEATVNRGFGDVLSEFLSQRFGGETGESVKKNQQKIAMDLKHSFMGREGQEPTAEEAMYLEQRRLMEDRYGIDIAVVSLGDVDFSEDVQKARQTKAVIDNLSAGVADALGRKSYEEVEAELKAGTLSEASFNAAWDRVMVINGSATKQTFGIDMPAAKLIDMARAFLGGGKE
jgi:hypothetical protein